MMSKAGAAMMPQAGEYAAAVKPADVRQKSVSAGMCLAAAPA
jgi:hypothetical protein